MRRAVRAERHADGKPVLVVDGEVEPLTAEDVRHLMEDVRR